MTQRMAFDIEVAGFRWEEVDEITRGYLLQRAKTEEDRSTAPERMRRHGTSRPTRAFRSTVAQSSNHPIDRRGADSESITASAVTSRRAWR